MDLKTMRRGGQVSRVFLAAALITGMTAASAQSAPTLQGNKAYSGYAHDIKTYVGGAVTSGPVVAAGVGCSDRAPLYFQDSAANVSFAGVSLATDLTKSEGLKSGTVQTNRSTFDATYVNLPIVTNGLKLTADAITVVSTTNYDTAAGTFTTSSSMNVTNLKVQDNLLPAIITINGAVGANTGFNIP
ncbi:MAG: choice-of-anchor P family protein, partial [Humibacillus sp.]